MDQDHGAGHSGIGEFRVVTGQLRSGEHPLVDNGSRRQGGEVNTLVAFGPRPHAGVPGSGSFADLPLGPLPERVDEAIELDSGCVGVGGRG